MFVNSSIIFGIGASHFIKIIVISHVLLAHSSFSLMSFKFMTSQHAYHNYVLFVSTWNMLRSEMWIPLSSNVVMSIMVVFFFAYVAPTVIMSISIPLGCTFVGDYVPTSPSFCVVACPSINHYSTSFSSFDLWIYTKSTSVIHGLPYLFELQPLLHLHRNSIIDVPTLYMSWIIECANCTFSCGITFLPHTPRMTMNGWWPHCQRLIVQYSSIFPSFKHFIFFSQHFCFLLSSMLTSLCFFLPC